LFCLAYVRVSRELPQCSPVCYGPVGQVIQMQPTRAGIGVHAFKREGNTSETKHNP